MTRDRSASCESGCGGGKSPLPPFGKGGLGGFVSHLLQNDAERVSVDGIYCSGSFDVLKQKRPLHSQVTFIFAGAEEVGLQGAFAFVQRHKDRIEAVRGVHV